MLKKKVLINLEFIFFNDNIKYKNIFYVMSVIIC